ncbi:MAG: YraN family protein [Spirochaetes bacterium GWC1_27_15]|nr:MAG: YraN family protein [Spirochaetes bacterium GWB1_27_13]OHD28109.1 MAG: YraN family protein [Spirochaetes bacterium GWC1_27_15]
MDKKELGRIGEEFAANFLQKKGIQIIKRNYFTKFGEIDLIGIENKTIIFVEVKLRQSNVFGFPYESITNKKLEKIYQLAESFLLENDFSDFDCRFDVISLIYYHADETFKVEWLKNQYFS